MLVPITSTWQLRPDLTHLDAEAVAASAAAKAEADEGGPALTQVHVRLTLLSLLSVLTAS